MEFPLSSACDAILLFVHLGVIEALNYQLDAQWSECGTFLHVERAIMDRISEDKSDVGVCMLQLVENRCATMMEQVACLAPGRHQCWQ